MIIGDNVTIKYNGREVVTDASFKILDNRVTCIIGPNASGKTTLMRAIAGRVRYEGSILLDGVEVSTIPVKRLASLVTLVEGLGQRFAGVKVWDVLISARHAFTRGFFDTDEDVEAVRNASGELGIQHLLDRDLWTLSSGELQRVLLATALVKESKYILLDEPDVHLDVRYKKELSRLLTTLKVKHTVVISTHDLVFASNVCEDIILLSMGRIVAKGSRRDMAGILLDNLENVFGVKIGVSRHGEVDVLVPLYL